MMRSQFDRGRWDAQSGSWERCARGEWFCLNREDREMLKRLTGISITALMVVAIFAISVFEVRAQGNSPQARIIVLESQITDPITTGNTQNLPKATITIFNYNDRSGENFEFTLTKK